MAPHPTYLQLCREEPYRIFFPLGVLIGISGVSLWPLYFSGLHKFYPGIMHARLMIEGFMGAFVIGFLGTAAPRLTGTAHFSWGELGTLLVLFLSAVGLHIGERYLAGDTVFLVLLLFFAVRMGWRFSRRADVPPPSFVLVAFGFFNAILGAALVVITTAGNGSMYWMLFGAQLLNQGFILYLVLGVGGFLLPRFLALPGQPKAPERPQLSWPWKRRALLAAGVGAALWISFAVEVFAEAPRIAGLLRFTTVALFLALETPAHLSTAPPVTITRSPRGALLFILLGLLFPILWPWQRVAGLHLIFIGGFTLLTFTVATRVVLGHSGHEHLFHRMLPFLRATAVLLLLAAMMRAAGDFFPLTRGSWLTQAAYLWMLAAFIWGWRVLPKVCIAGSETSS